MIVGRTCGEFLLLVNVISFGEWKSLRVANFQADVNDYTRNSLISIS